jgi:hypothetical protein
MPSSEPVTGGKSMARLSLLLAVFLLPLAFLWAALEWSTVRIPTSYSSKRLQLSALSGRIDTLILGASSAYYGVVPNQLSGAAFNLADVIQSLYYDDQLLTRALPKLPRLRRVVVPVQYISLFFELDDFFESWRQYFYAQEWGIPPRRFRDRLDIRMWSRVALLTPRSSILSLRPALSSTPAVENTDDRGWSPAVAADNEVSRLDAAYAARRLAQYHGTMMHPGYEEANLSYLEHIISLLQAHHVECVLVTLPVWATFRDGMRADMWDRTQNDIQHLVKIHGVRYLSFLNQPQLEAADFFDVDHLSPRGAVRFTKMLNAELQRTAGP